MDEPTNMLLHQIFQNKARRHPESYALEHPHGRLTYRELNEQSNSLSWYLRETLAPGRDVVALALEKSPLLVIAILAVLKAGMIWIPLPDDASADRIRYILQSSNTGLLLGSASSNALHAGTDVPFTPLDELLQHGRLRAYSTEDPDHATIDAGRSDRDLCHILFTSGSTGTPKGVMIEHRAVRHNALELTKMFGLDSQTRTLQFAAPTFDVFGLDLFMTFACGGCLVMAPRETMMEDMTAFLKRTRVTYAQLTPTVIQTIDPSGVPDLRVLASSGEILPQQLADKWRHVVRLFNAYGPTETIVCTVEDLSRNTDVDAGCVGRAVPGLEVRILADGDIRPVSAGEVGEICVAGPQILRGYLSKNAATEARMCLIDGVRFYRTGDLGCSHVSPSGVSTIRLIGRKDTEVKIRGIRLDLADVEGSILSCSDVRKCVVLMPRHGVSSGRLCAFLVLTVGCNNTLLPRNKPRFRLIEPSEEISSVLHRVQSTTSAQLPPMAIPKTWWPIDEIPLTSSSKIDRLNLQSWLEELDEDTFRTLIGQYRVASQDDRRGAVSAEERRLQSVWAEVLLRSVATVSVTDSLADLGADSLDVIRMANGARKAGIHVNAADIFAAKTIQEVVRRHRANGLTAPEAASLSLSAAPYHPFEMTPPSRPLAPLIEEAAYSCGVALAAVEDIYPCTPYQSALMALDIKCPGSYLCIFSWTLRGDIEISRLQEAWNTLLDSNAALRNRLIWDAGTQQLLQVQVRRDPCDWSESLYEAPMTLGSDLCRGLTRWDAKRERWTFHLKIHHSIIDGWSLSLMLNQLKKLYFGEAVNTADTSPYAHYVRHYLTEQDRLQKSSHEFWTSYLQGFGDSGCDSFLSKPQDPHHEVHATDHQTLTVTLDLKELATRFGVTPAVVLYGITALIFATHSDTDDVSLGLIQAGREAPVDGVYQMIGPVFACIPFRTEVNRQRSLADFFQQIHAQILAIGPHQQFGLERIKKCGPGAKAACNLETLVVVQPEDERLAGTGLWEEVHGQTSGLADSIPFSLELILRDDGVLINCNSDPACIVRQHARIIMEHLNQVLLSLTNLSPKITAREIQMTPQGHSSRFVQWADVYGPPVDVCLHDLLGTGADKFADSDAVYESSTGRKLTFKELNDASTRLASFLIQSCHVPEGAVVAIAMEKSALAIVTIFAILKTGSAYLPIEPSWPLERVRRIVNDAGVYAVVCSTSLRSRYESLWKQLIPLDGTHLDSRGSDTRTSSAELISKGRPSDLAVLMYTSGSTGTPKGVMLEHRAMSTSLTHLARVFGLRPGYRHLQFSAFVYDVSISDIFIPLLSGACICIPTEDERLNGLSEAIRKMKINSAILTPSMAGLIRLDDGESLKTIMTGGEMTNRALIRTWAPRIRLLNAYGPTEAAITTTVTDPQGIDSDPSVIGRNVTGWHLILRRDDSGQLYEAPFGCAGEIAIAGHSLARGYLNNAALTAEQFVTLPFLEGSPLPSRVYLTGDIGRYELDGSVRILGRRDRMIKINGIRVDPGEAEYRLRKLGGSFASAVVQCIVDQNGNSRLAAFVPVNAIHESKERLILVDAWTSEFRKMCSDGRQRLLELLPRAYVPSLFIPVSHIPSTVSDKIDYKWLRDELQKFPLENFAMSVDEEMEPGDEMETVEPSTPMERIMSNVFKKVFPTNREFGVTTDFFRLGGDSFSAMKLVSAAKEHNLEITVQQIYRHSRLKDLAAVARYSPGADANRRKSNSGNGEIRPENTSRVLVSEYVWKEVADQSALDLEEIEDVYPATPFQQGLMAVSLQGKGTYSAKMVFELAESVDVSRLTQAIEGVVLDTPILRTSLVSSTQGLMQVVRKGSALTSDAKATTSFQYQVDTASLSGRPRLRIEMHHSLYDGPTIEILLRDVNSRYANVGNVPNSSVAYRKFVDYLESTDSESAREFWEKTLHDAPLATFPPCEDESRAGATQHVTLTTNITLDLTKKCGISAGTLAAGATALLLGAYSFADQVCFGMTFSGRDIPEWENVAGPTLSTVPMCVAVPRDQEASGFLQQVQNLVVDMRQHQHYGLQNIAQLPEQGPRNAARFRTLLVLQQGSHQPADTEQGSNIIGDLVDDESSMHVEYPLVIVAHANPVTGSVDLKVEFDPCCLSSVEATRFIQQLGRAIEELSQPHRAVSELDLITAFDKEEISNWNPRPPKAPAQNLCQMFREKTLRQPDSPALEYLVAQDGDASRRRLTYRQLDTRSTALSSTIQRHASDKLWVVLCHRDPVSVITAMLATWKAGKAIVTIDPTVPVDRRHTILAELGDAVIFTEASEVQTFAKFQVHVLDGMLQDADDIPDQSSATTSSLPVASDIAYVFFTSGSSGTPKGVVVPHSAIALSLSDVSANMGLDSNTRMLQFASCSFDTSLMEIFATLIAGGCVCIPTRNQRVDGTLAHAANSLQVTHMILTPTVASLLQPTQLPSVQCLMLVGEPPSTQVIERWTSQDVSRRVQIMNGYGPTEAAVHSSTNFDLCGNDPRNIGRATACAMFLVLPDDPNRLAPVGTVGELVIYGETVSEGYLNQPELTRHAFGVDPPWAPWSEPGLPVRYYRTGDLACYSPDGSMVYLGRRDLQAKIHGQRLDVSEIEWQIRRCSRFSDCVVEVLQESTLVAFVLTSQGSTEPYTGPLPPSQIDASAVAESQSRLRSVLPDYMVPSVYIPCSSWPMTTSGKTDRRRLRASVKSSIDQYRIRQKHSRRLAQTSSQKKLFESIGEVMSIPQDQIGLDDSVLSLGGDSITMIRLLAVARQRKLNIDATKAFRSTTLENLAASTEDPPTEMAPVAVNGNDGPPAPFSLLPVSSKDPHHLSRIAAACDVPLDCIIDAYPCTTIQEDLMVASAKTPGAFLNQEVFRLPAQVSVAKMIRTIDALWQRHGILRTRIILDQDYRALQVVLREDADVQETSTDNLQEFLHQDSLVSLEYGTKLSRCALVSVQASTYLVLTQHHAVFDGWSMNILKGDLQALYSEADKNLAPAQPYAIFVRHSLQIYDSPDAKQYWQSQLADVQAAPLPQAQSTVDFSTNRKYAFTTAFANSTDYTLAVLAEAAWGALLGRYLECEDVSFGVIRSGRAVPIPDIDTLMGPTIASIPRRLRPSKEQSVKSYLQKVQREVFEATPWEQYGLSNIRKVSKSAGQVCKFNSMLVVQSPAVNEATDDPAALLTSQAELAKGFINSDCLIIDAQATAKDEVTVSIIYDDRVTSKDDAHWMAYHFSQTLVQLSTSDTINLGELSISGLDRLNKEREWNSTDIDASHRLVDEIFTTNARQWSDLPAVQSPDASLTYAQLDSLSSAGAHILRFELGVRCGDLVPLLMTKSSVMVASMLAILKAGAAYIPLPADAPLERLRFLIKETEARILLCTADHYELAQSLEVKAVSWDLEQLYESAPTASSETENALVRSSYGHSRSPSDLAYILFTSGSTGTPKGVMIEHSALATTALVNGIKMNYQVGTRTLSFAAYTFDVNVIEIYLTLLHGGCLYIPPEKRRLGDLSGFINDSRIELAFLTPTTIQNLLGSPSRVPSLKTLRSGGEPLSKSILREWSPGVRLINSYGPTETCVDACRNPDMKTDCDPNNIGFAIGTHLWAVERGNYDSLTPIGCPGELLISGPTLARGYFKDEARTQAAFIDGSQYAWVKPGEERLYATGDIVTRNADGSITYIGRRDLQVKLNGFRIELGEIEYNLEQCPAVVSAVVDKVNSQEGGSDLLVAFLRVTQHSQSDSSSPLLPPSNEICAVIEGVQARIDGLLPPYMVPRVYLPVTRIPLTLSNKTDRKALQKLWENLTPEQILPYQAAPAVLRQPTSATERILQGLWAQVLKIDPKLLGLDTQFTRVGGDSLHAIGLASLCRELGFKLEVADILRIPQLEAMARHVEENRRAAKLENQNGNVKTAISVNTALTEELRLQAAEACGLSPDDIEEVYPCAPIQESLMASTLRQPGSYIDHSKFIIPQSTDITRFRKAWQLAHEANPIMRTRICAVTTDKGMRMMQVVANCPSEWIDDDSEPDSAMRMELGAPLVRYRLRPLGEEFVFEMWRHHAIFDGFSSTALWEDLLHAFETSTIPRTRPSYRTFVDFIQSIESPEAISFWKDQLNGHQPEPFPIFPSPDHVPQASSKTSQTLSGRLTWDSTSPFTFSTVARAAWAVTLAMRSRSSGVDKDICFATTLSGRTAPLAGIDAIIGPTIATVPVRVQFDLDRSVTNLLQKLQDQALDMLPFEHLGLGRIREINKSARDACASANLLVIQPDRMGGALPLSLRRPADPEIEDDFREPFGLVIECTQNRTKDEISVSAAYDEALLSEPEVSHILEHFQQMIGVLHQAAHREESVQSALWQLAVGADLPRTVEWNSRDPYTPMQLHELVERAAEKYPDQPAIDCHDGQMSYMELVEAADCVARILQRDYGVRPGDFVPICTEKSQLMIIGILGIMKAGAGYVPLDTNHPDTRMQWIINEADARVLVASPLQEGRRQFPVQTLVLALDRLSSAVSTPREELEKSSPDDVAYVIFTSGTSGTPKGVVMQHKAASYSILEHAKRYRHDNTRHSLQFSSYVFDASVVDIFAVLASGGCVHVPSETMGVGDLEDFIREKGINFADLTPTVANLLDPSQVPSLTALAIGGEMANRALLRKWGGKYSPVKYMVNAYGPTEAGIACAMGELTRSSAVGDVGTPLAAGLWIVDARDHNRLVPIGCVGELVVTGETLAQGYLNRPEETRRAFLIDVPWLAKAGERRLYKTGDLARFNINGHVELVGRREDSQVKFRGLRIELGEIETAIGALPQWASRLKRVAVAVIQRDEIPILVSFIQFSANDSYHASQKEGSIFCQPSDSFKAFVSDAKKSIEKQLPTYMVPQLWLPVSDWPLSASSKTNRKLLILSAENLDGKQVDEYQRVVTTVNGRTNGKTNGRAPSSGSGQVIGDMEEAVKETMIQVLHKDPDCKIDPETDFFQLGGDSLTAIMLVMELRKRATHVSAHDIFAERSVRGIAGQCRPLETTDSTATNGNGSTQGLVSEPDFDQIMPDGDSGTASTDSKQLVAWVERAEIEDAYPASDTQTTFLIEGLKWPRSYYGWFFFELSDCVGIGKVREACCALVARHSILRTSFHLRGGKCFQAVHAPGPSIDFKVFVCRNVPSEQCAMVDHDVRHPVKLGEILTRFRLFIDPVSGTRTLMLGLSHAQYDGFCLATMFNDLRSAYLGTLNQATKSLGLRPFIEYTLKISNEKTDKFWQKTIESSTMNTICDLVPTTRQPVMSESIMRTIPFKYKDPELSDYNYGALAKSAWALTLTFLSYSYFPDHSDVTFWNLVSGRFAPFSGAQDVVGPCINFTPTRIPISSDKAVSDLVEDMHSQMIDCMPYEATPTSRIIKQSVWSTNLANFGTIFQYQNIPDPKPPSDDSHTPWSVKGGAVCGGGLLQSGACWMMAWPNKDGFSSFRFTYSPQTLSPGTAEAVMTIYLDLLRDMNDDPSLPIKAVMPSHEPLKLIDPPDTSKILSPARVEIPPALQSIESQVKALWKILLNPPREIHTNDSFFDIGGDSIKAAELGILCEKAGLHLTLQDILDIPILGTQTLLIAGQVSRPERIVPQLEFRAAHELS